ncbi:HIT domain-containing protein [Pseudidiomarina halophila]|uniref:Diadenosine tetraphosphate hydrolase n=1 Tax=Pseudidiomarina halophila TaxID=1449799 RepID=A0A432XZK8_9GAMM|nr:HIT domain-containing protein [Pseudidiomarina halophila]RUO54054.1 diadenosine tetraphosphate hydrolase [Pseudidiomarina halophila]
MRYNKPKDESNLFVLDERLAHDCLRLGAFGLCEVLLFDDTRYDWLVLVPRRPGLVEFLDLSNAEQQQLALEIQQTSHSLKEWRPTAKLNVGALGNVVSQLHVHLVLRESGDPAWPGPVWGHSAAHRHSAGDATERCAVWRQRLGL